VKRSKQEADYSRVSWTATEVQQLAPSMSRDEAETWIDLNAYRIQHCVKDLGRKAIAALLRSDGIDTSKSQETQ
jgi:hypothetical protein